MKKNKIRVLLMTSKNDTRDFYVATAPPIGLYRLKHYLFQRGIGCDILDLGIQPELEEKYIGFVEKGEYEIVGMSVTHHNMVLELDTLWKFRSASEKSPKRCLFIAGGQEATLNYSQWLNIGIDLVLLGFAEKSLYELCERFSRDTDSDLSQIVEGMNGYALRDKNNKIIFRPKEVLTQSEFQELSFQQVMELDVPYDVYWRALRIISTSANFHENKFVPETVRLYTTSHCPMSCGFCSSRSFLPISQGRKSPIAMLSASEIIQLIIHHIKKYGAKGFLFSDDDFLIGSKVGLDRVFEVCRLIIESKKNGIIPSDTVFNCQARIDDFLIRDDHGKKIVNQSLINALSDAGFLAFGMGIETFSDRLLKCRSVNKSIYNKSDICRVLDALLEKGLNPAINLILAIPETTIEDMFHSMKISTEYFQKSCQLAVTTVMDSFPGSSIYGDPEYPITTKRWKNPNDNETVLISNYFIPQDKKIADILDKIKENSDQELEKIKGDCSWHKPVVPKPITGLSIFIAISKLLKRYDLMQYFTDVTYETFRKEMSF